MSLRTALTTYRDDVSINKPQRYKDYIVRFKL
jgi:hypothetical protein